MPDHFSTIADVFQSHPAPGDIGFLVNIILSLLLGAVIGYERRIKQKVAGVRTHMVIAVSSCLITMCGHYVAHGSSHIDPTRVAAQILSGIGFVGAGVIIRQGFSTSGVTTAATILFAAGIGIACGFSLFTLAIITCMAVVTAMMIANKVLPTTDSATGCNFKVSCPIDKFDTVMKIFGQNSRVESIVKQDDRMKFNIATTMNADQVVQLFKHSVKNDDIISLQLLSTD